MVPITFVSLVAFDECGLPEGHYSIWRIHLNCYICTHIKLTVCPDFHFEPIADHREFP